ncbi:MAG: DNA-binding beta-propeller fold protein YncE [Myxococcota bacterium]|jgi:DNA-binding beta-propeller fold protein YncE
MFLLLALATAFAQDQCATPEASFDYTEGFRSQRGNDTENALASYTRCLEKDPDCVACQYEIGWSYWTRSEWDQVIGAWERTLVLQPGNGAAIEWLVKARENKSGSVPSAGGTGLHVAIGTTSSPADAPVQLELIGRFQNYNPNPSNAADHHDIDIYSPKSARFLGDGTRVYVNSLEGLKTVVYDPRDISKVHTITHTFGAEDAGLFQGMTTVYDYPYMRTSPSGDPNQFSGKPVESALSHDDRYLWVPYYRREFDVGAGSPSAVSIIDTQTNEVVRVLPTGPIPKYVAISPDNTWAAITHWGDNTVAMVDISSGDPAQFTYRDERLVVERILSQQGLTGSNRDSACGSCLRGTTFTPDGETLLVARMGDGGIAGFDVDSGTYLGTVDGPRPTPRHLVVSPDGQTLFFTSNRSGTVSRAPLSDLVSALRGAEGGHVDMEFRSTSVGGGARTLEVSPDGRYLFTAVNGRSQIVVVDANTLDVVAKVRTDSFTVGLAVSPDGSQVWTTSQGRSTRGGGNSVCVYGVTYRTVAESFTPLAD